MGVFFVANFNILATEINEMGTFCRRLFFFVANFNILATEINEMGTFWRCFLCDKFSHLGNREISEWEHFGDVFFVTNFHILATEK